MSLRMRVLALGVMSAALVFATGRQMSGQSTCGPCFSQHSLSCGYLCQSSSTQSQCSECYINAYNTCKAQGACQ